MDVEQTADNGHRQAQILFVKIKADKVSALILYIYWLFLFAKVVKCHKPYFTAPISLEIQLQQMYYI